ncbi:hypothetical protein PRIEUP_LOCUS1034 [Pristimantis euphronides]
MLGHVSARAHTSSCLESQALVSFLRIVPRMHKCPKNKIWNDCGTICTPNCATVKGWACPFICRLGAGTCTCRSPYVFLSGKSGPCVLPKDCPKK